LGTVFSRFIAGGELGLELGLELELGKVFGLGLGLGLGAGGVVLGRSGWRNSGRVFVKEFARGE